MTKQARRKTRRTCIFVCIFVFYVKTFDNKLHYFCILDTLQGVFGIV